MNITVYADFTCPLSFLAHQRLEQLVRQGVEQVRWRAVLAEPGRPVTGRVLTPSSTAELRGAVLHSTFPDERLPVTTSRLSHAGALTAAYAEAVTDGVADLVRRAFLESLWQDGQELSDAVDVRRVITQVMNPDVPAVERRLPGTPLIPLGIDRTVAMRRSGGTITRLGGPISTIGQRRMTGWQQAWTDHGRPPLPMVVTDRGEARNGAEALAYLRDLLSPADAVAGSLPTAMCPAPDSRDPRLVTA